MLIIVVNNVVIGIVISLFFRNLNFILKIFVSVFELMFTVVLCWMIFGIVIDMYIVIVIFIVFVVIVLYV